MHPPGDSTKLLTGREVLGAPYQQWGSSHRAVKFSLSPHSDTHRNWNCGVELCNTFSFWCNTLWYVQYLVLCAQYMSSVSFHLIPYVFADKEKHFGFWLMDMKDRSSSLFLATRHSHSRIEEPIWLFRCFLEPWATAWPHGGASPW